MKTGNVVRYNDTVHVLCSKDPWASGSYNEDDCYWNMIPIESNGMLLGIHKNKITYMYGTIWEYILDKHS